MPPSGTTSVALATMPTPQPAPPSPGQSSQPQQSNTTTQIATTVAQNLSTALTSQATHSPTSAVAIQARPPPNTVSERLRAWLCQTWIGNCTAIVGTFLAVIGVLWTLYAGVVGLRLAIWSSRNDALQSCLSLRADGIFSAYCNKTIEAGVTAPPLTKRTVLVTVEVLGLNFTVDMMLSLPLPIAISVGLGVLTIIYFNPMIRPCTPVTSLVRSDCHGPAGGMVPNLIPGVLTTHLKPQNGTTVSLAPICLDGEDSQEQDDTENSIVHHVGMEGATQIFDLNEYESDGLEYPASQTSDDDDTSDDFVLSVRINSAMKGTRPVLKTTPTPEVRFSDSIQLCGEANSSEDAENGYNFNLPSFINDYESDGDGVSSLSSLLRQIRLDQPKYQMSWWTCNQTFHKTYIQLMESLGRGENEEIIEMDTNVLQELSDAELANFGLVLVKASQAVAVRAEDCLRVEDFGMGFSGLIILLMLWKSIPHQADAGIHPVSTALVRAVMEAVIIELDFRLFEQFMAICTLGPSPLENSRNSLWQQFLERLSIVDNQYRQNRPPLPGDDHCKQMNHVSWIFETVLNALQEAMSPDVMQFDSVNDDQKELDRAMQQVLLFIMQAKDCAEIVVPSLPPVGRRISVDREVLFAICPQVHEIALDLTVDLFAGSTTLKGHKPYALSLRSFYGFDHDEASLSRRRACNTSSVGSSVITNEFRRNSVALELAADDFLGPGIAVDETEDLNPSMKSERLHSSIADQFKLRDYQWPVITMVRNSVNRDKLADWVEEQKEISSQRLYMPIEDPDPSPSPADSVRGLGDE